MKKFKKGFSLIELSIVLIIISVLVAGVIGGAGLLQTANIVKARTAVSTSPIMAIDGLNLWFETTSKDSFENVPSNGDAISTWKNLNQTSDIKPDAIATSAPTYIKDGLNGLPVLRFTIANIMEIDGGGITNTKGIEVFVVVNNTETTAGWNASFCLWKESSNQRQFIVGKNNLNNFYSHTSANGVSASGAIDSTQSVGNAFILNISHDQTTGSFYIDNSLINTHSFGLYATPDQNYGIGGFNDVGSYGGDIAEIIVYNRALNATERQNIVEYLSDKWGISIN